MTPVVKASPRLPRLLPAGLMALALTVVIARAHSTGRQVPNISDETRTAYGIIVFSIHPSNQDHKYSLRMIGGQTYRLVVCAAVVLGDLAPNSLVAITYTHISGDLMYSCKQPEVLQRPARRQMFGDTITQPTQPAFLVYLVSMCNNSSPAAGTPKEVNETFFGNGSASYQRTLVGYFDTCSYGQVSVRPSNVKVFGPVDVPCSGKALLRGTSTTFDTKSCGDDNLFKWQAYVDTLARANGIVPADYHHKIMIMPTGFLATKPNCNGVSGLATSGMSQDASSSVNSLGTGLVWLAGDILQARDLEIMFHETAHTLGLAHADIPGGCGVLGDQCDHTCAMGAAGGQGIRCLNAPHTWQLGWGRPFSQLSDADLAIGAYVNLTLPSQLSTPKSFVTVSLSGLALNQKIYVASRINKPPYDLPFAKDQDGKPHVLLHSYDGTADKAYKRTILLADLPLGAQYTNNDTGLVVRFNSWDEKRGAAVTLCRRRQAAEASCGDDIDDDCDFLPDKLDPDCSPSQSSQVVGMSTSAKPPVFPPPARPPPSPKPSSPPFPKPNSPPSPKPSSFPSPKPSPPPSPKPSPPPSPKPSPPPSPKPNSPPSPKPNSPPSPKPSPPSSPKPSPPPSPKPSSPPSPKPSPPPSPKPSSPPPPTLSPSPSPKPSPPLSPKPRSPPSPKPRSPPYPQHSPPPSPKPRPPPYPKPSSPPCPTPSSPPSPKFIPAPRPPRPPPSPPKLRPPPAGPQPSLSGPLSPSAPPYPLPSSPPPPPQQFPLPSQQPKTNPLPQTVLLTNKPLWPVPPADSPRLAPTSHLPPPIIRPPSSPQPKPPQPPLPQAMPLPRPPPLTKIIFQIAVTYRSPPYSVNQTTDVTVMPFQAPPSPSRGRLLRGR